MLEDPSGPDRRQARRYPVRLPVTVFSSGAAIAGTRGHTVDISARGLRMVTDADLDHDGEQTVIMEVPGPSIVVQADLVWSELRGEQWVHGVILVDMDADDESRLSKLCAERV